MNEQIDLLETFVTTVNEAFIACSKCSAEVDGFTADEVDDLLQAAVEAGYRVVDGQVLCGGCIEDAKKGRTP